MKLLYFIQDRLKLVSLIAGIMVIIIVTNILSQHNLNSIDQTFHSIYHDRLIPATELFYVSNAIHLKSDLMNDYYAQNSIGRSEGLNARVKKNNVQIDSLIKEFEKSYLVEKEKIELSKLKSEIKSYRKLEALIVAAEQKNIGDHGKILFEKEGRFLLTGIEKQLEVLTNIQSTVGNELIKESKLKIAESNSLSSIQIVIVILIGLVAQGLILSLKVFQQKSQQFHLN